MRLEGKSTSENGRLRGPDDTDWRGTGRRHTSSSGVSPLRTLLKLKHQPLEDMELIGNDRIWKLKDFYEEVKSLASGSFSHVLSAIDKSTGE
jgi:hypothetical protein